MKSSVISRKHKRRVGEPSLGDCQINHRGSKETFVSHKAFEQAFRSLRRGGTLTFVALPADNYMQLPIFETVLNGNKIVGSIVGTRLDLAEVFDLHAAGKTHVIYETRHLEDVNHAFEEVEQRSE